MHSHDREAKDQFELIVGHSVPEDRAPCYHGLVHRYDRKPKRRLFEVLKSHDPLFGRGYVRADGRVIHDVYLFRAKTQSESHGKWDLYDYVSTVPGDQALRPIAAGGCPMVKS